MAKMGRPRIMIDDPKLRALMRLKPSIADTAAFFECSVATIENYLRDNYDLTFSAFRDQNMVHTRFMLIRTALKKAEKGDNCMLIFCLKNLCGWRDKQIEEELDHIKAMSGRDLMILLKEKSPELLDFK